MVALVPSRTIALQIFHFSVHWYGIMYLLAAILGIILLPHLQRARGLTLTRDEWLSVVSWGVIGVIVGGRFGYVLFYEPMYFAVHPSEIIAIWNGGMSSHGGFIGVTASLLLFGFFKKIDVRTLADVVVVPVALGLALGRFGNFINQELYGTVTTLPWGIVIPGVEGFRHPTQLYAVAKDLFIAMVCLGHLQLRPAVPGRTFALFLMLYGVLRFLLEYLREQPYPLINLGLVTLSRGQLLTLPIFIMGALLWIWLKPPSSNEPVSFVKFLKKLRR